MLDRLQLVVKYFPVHSAFIGGGLALAIYWRLRGQARAWFLALAGWLFAAVLAGPAFAIQTLALTLITTAIARYLQRAPKARWTAALYWLGLALPLLNLALFKYGLAPGLRASLGLVRALGVSYYTFKLLHLVIDSRRGRLREIDARLALAFVFFVPTFPAGPIYRYRQFVADLDGVGPLDSGAVRTGTRRLIYGLFFKFILADRLGFWAAAQGAPGQLGRGALALVLLAWALQIFLDFKGYSDIAIGLARFFGFQAPENFRTPYLKPNLVLFWQNWHITLTSWLREYVYLPLGKWLLPRIGREHPWLINALAQLVTMGLVGLWHGSTLNFLVWGLYHGVGLSLYRIYSDLSQRYLPEAARSALGGPAGRLAGTLATFGFVALGWVFFVNDLPAAVSIISRLLGIGR
ncbi:MAG: MBOAT family O-acyltransferase [Bacillota bacterium]